MRRALALALALAAPSPPSAAADPRRPSLPKLTKGRRTHQHSLRLSHSRSQGQGLGLGLGLDPGSLDPTFPTAQAAPRRLIRLSRRPH